MNTKRMPQEFSCTDSNPATEVALLEVNLFGPRSAWSSLLGQREHLHQQIAQSRKYLEQLRKDLGACGTLLEAWPDDEQNGGNGWRPDPAQETKANNTMEPVLLLWLEQLEERLGAVVKEIEEFESQPVPVSVDIEESVIELLRAAG